VGGAADPVVETRRLAKRYGTVDALVDLDLVVGRGEILGYLGPNGAGKTTTIRLLLGLLHPSAGEARAFGLDCWRESVEVRRRLGYLPGDVRLYDGLTGRRFLALFARLRRCGPTVRTAAEELAERLRLDLSRRIKTYSKGMKQKLGLIQAFMHDPELLILDEPTSALDPLVQQDLYALLRERRQAGATVFFSSHVLSEVEKVCDRVAIVRDGRLLAVRQVSELAELHLRRVRVRFADPARGASALRAAGFAPEERAEVWELTLRGEIDPLLRTLARQKVTALTVEPLSLEEVFLRFYRPSEASPELRA
jgi:ABC-2 type transport system ATP-binding protein